MVMKKLAYGMALLASVVCLLGAIAVKADEVQPAPLKSLVVYYSYTGKTELVAKTLADILKAELLKIEDVSRPTKEQAYGAGKQASIEGKSWPIQPFKTDLSGYDRIFVGSPVWFSMPAPEFNAFVDQASFTGKQVVVFVTFGGGGQDKALKAMTDKIEAKGGKVVSSFSIKTGKATENDIVAKTKETAKRY
jgi:flavodoxin